MNGRSDRPRRRLIFVVAVVACAGAATAGWSWLLAPSSPALHLPRTLAAVLPIAAAALLVPSPNRQAMRRPLLRIAALAVCVMAAIAGWWLAPTREGLNRFAAFRASRSLEQRFGGLQPEALAEAERLAAEAGEVSAQFPRLARRWEPSLQQWRQQSVGRHVRQLEAISTGDIGGYRQASAESARLKQICPAARPPLERAEAAWMRATSAAFAEGVSDLAQSRPEEAVPLLQAHFAELAAVPVPPPAAPAVEHHRQQMVLSILDAYRGKALALIKLQAYQQAADVADRLRGQLLAEAIDVGLSEELADFRTACQYLAELAAIPDG